MMTQLHMAVSGKPNQYIPASVISEKERIVQTDSLLKKIYKQFPELRNANFLDFEDQPQKFNEFPQFYRQLKEVAIDPSFLLDNYLQADSKQEPQFAGSFESTILGSKFSRIVFTSPRARIDELLSNLQTYAMLPLFDSLNREEFSRAQTGADGYTIQTVVTQLKYSYDEKTDGTEIYLPVSTIEKLGAGTIPVVSTFPMVGKTQFELTHNDFPVRIPENIKAFRLDTKFRLLFK